MIKNTWEHQKWVVFNHIIQGMELIGTVHPHRIRLSNMIMGPVIHAINIPLLYAILSHTVDIIYP